MGLKYTPPNKEELKIQYDMKKASYSALLSEIDYFIKKILYDNKIRYNAIESRGLTPKDFESFYEKINQNKITDNFFEKVEDFAGIRIICLYRSDLGKIESIFRENFRILRAKLLRESEEFSFGYMSDFYIVKFPLSFKGPRYDPIINLKCEIQVRSVSMHAWASVSHHLVYKKESDVPTESIKDFIALSGVFYIADTLFEQFRIDREQKLNEMLESIKEDKFNLMMEVNYDSLNAYALWKFPKRYDLDGSNYPFELRSILNDIKSTDIKTLQNLHELVDKHWDDFIKADKEEATKESKEIYFSSIGVIRYILYLEYPELAELAKMRNELNSMLENYDAPDYYEPDYPEPEPPEPDYPEPDYPELEPPEPDYPEPDYPELEPPEPEYYEPDYPEPEPPEPDYYEPEPPEPDYPEPDYPEPEPPEPDYPEPEDDEPDQEES